MQQEISQNHLLRLLFKGLTERIFAGKLGPIIFFLLFFLVLPAYSAFEDVDLGARSLGMGSASVSLSDDAGGIFWNPASIAGLDSHELSMSYMELYSLVSYSAIGYVQRLAGLPFGIGLKSSNDSDGIYRETEFILSSAYNITSRLSSGANIKYLSSAVSVGNTIIGKGAGLSMDFGFRYIPPWDILSLDASFQNLPGYVSYNRKKYLSYPGDRYSQMPDISYKVGSCIYLNRLFPVLKDAILAIQLSDGNLCTGAEYAFRNFAFIRSGLRFGNALNRALTVGFGIRLNSIRLDYAYVGSDVGAQTSQFSVSLRW